MSRASSTRPDSQQAKTRATQLRAVKRYYKWLDRWVRWHRIVRRYSGYDSLTVHRLLTDPVTGENGPLVLPKIGGQWLGLTISPIQIARAREESAKRGLSDRIRFALESYDVPREGPFDLVIGIESLVHCADPPATIANLAASMAPGGHLLLVDDMPVEPFPTEQTDDLNTFKQMWHAPVMPSEPGWGAAFEAAHADARMDRATHDPGSEYRRTCGGAPRGGRRRAISPAGGQEARLTPALARQRRSGHNRAHDRSR